MNSKIKNISRSEKLLECVNSSWKTQVIYAAAELKIADCLSKGPKNSNAVAKWAHVHAPSMHRLLQALTTLDICKKRKDGRFEMTPMGLLLKTDAHDSLRSWILWWGGHLWNVWGNLLYSVRTGKSARKLLTGKDGFRHLENNSKAAGIFGRAMSELTHLASKNILNAYDFSNLKSIMDIGGGSGELLISILKTHKRIQAALFDLPYAVRQAKHRFEKAGLSSRCRFVSGDFFRSIPKGEDAYILKSVMHDWDDEKSRVILKNCRKAMTGKSRLLLIERVLPDYFKVSKTHQSAARSDLTMLAALGGKERTESEFRKLLDSAGLFIKKVTQADDVFSIIEAVIKI